MTPAGGATPPVGAYGLRLSGVEGSEHFLVTAPTTWEPFTLVRNEGTVDTTVEHVGPRRAELVAATGTSIRIDLDRSEVVFTAPTRPRLEEVIHPYLASVAAVTAFWRGCESFHAGAVAGDGGAWALAGERQAGKSSTLAWLATQGHALVCDDMLVLRGANVCAGPRSIDLRREATEALGIGTELGTIGTRERWRFQVGAVEPELPLRGFVFLEWGASVELTTLRHSEVLERLLPQRGIRLPPPRPADLLELARLPGLLLRRPTGLDSLPAAAGLIEEACL